jgi:hypothetical protein
MPKSLACLLLLLGCTPVAAPVVPEVPEVVETGGRAETDPPVVVDTEVPAETDAATPLDLHGDVPAVELLLPETFLAVAQSGEERGPADLIGRPTVLWFFPRSDTAG